MTEYNRDFLNREETADRLTQAYLEAVDMDNPPAPAEAALGLLSFIADGFREHNAGVPEGKQWEIPAGLGARQTAALVMKFHAVCLLPWPTVWPDEPDTQKDHCRLYIYQTHGIDVGLYTTDVLTVIEGFVPDIDLFTEQDVETILRDCAQVKERQDSEDFVAVDIGILNCHTEEVTAFSPEYIFTRRSQYEFGEWLLAWRRPA